MGAPKKIDVFRLGLTDGDRSEEDAASRARIERYRKELDPGIVLVLAIQAEKEWRADIGLAPVE